MQTPQTEDRTEQVKGYTWPSAKRAARIAAAQDGGTVSDYVHRLVIADLHRRGLLKPTENPTGNGAGVQG